MLLALSGGHNMAHFAELDEHNTVLRVIVISNDIVPDPAPDNEQAGIDFIHDTLNIEGTWKQCSYSGSFRGAYPGQGWKYDPINDVFVTPLTPEDDVFVTPPTPEDDEK